MKRILIFGLFAVMAYSVCNAEGWQILIGDEVAEELYASDSDSEQQEKTKSKQKSRSKSTSRSTSTSNGKTVTNIATSTSGQPSLKSIKDLAVYPLFGDKYKRHPHASLTVIESKSSYFRSLSVNEDAELTAKIAQLVERDAEVARSVVRTYDENKDEAVLSMDIDGRSCSVGFEKNVDGSSCSIFISMSLY